MTWEICDESRSTKIDHLPANATQTIYPENLFMFAAIHKPLHRDFAHSLAKMAIDIEWNEDLFRPMKYLKR